MRVKLQQIKVELRRRKHQSIPEQGSWLKQVVTGHFAYYAVPTNARALSSFRHYVTDLWRCTLRRRSQRDRFTWARMSKLADGWLPAPRILHPWPDQASPSHTQGRSRMLELGSSGSMRGLLGNEHPYRDPQSSVTLCSPSQELRLRADCGRRPKVRFRMEIARGKSPTAGVLPRKTIEAICGSRASPYHRL
jgi:hypothetical protein